MAHHAVDFFENQFRRQVSERDFALNPFEELALGHIAGTVLDLGCGLGNLSLEAGRRGHRVAAVEGSETAITRIRATARAERLEVVAVQADLEQYRIDQPYDTIVAIGILMFFHQARALSLLEDVQAHVAPGGRAIVNVLVEGTTFLDMFDPAAFYLFGRDELAARFAGWKVLLSCHHNFPAPRNTVKEFATLIAEKEGAGRAGAS